MYNPRFLGQVNKMSEEGGAPEDTNEDAFADGLAAVLAICIPWIAVIYWLSGLPTS